MCNIYNVYMVFAEGRSGKATSLDISGGRSCSRGAHSGVWQSLWKWLVLAYGWIIYGVVGLQKALEYNTWNSICIQGVTRHEAQQWCLAHAFELVELNPQELPDEDGEFYRQQKIQWHCVHLYFYSPYLANFVLIYIVFVALSDDFPESTGVKRIVQALNANVWSSVEMKDGEMTSPVQLPIALSNDYIIYLCVCVVCDSLYLYLIGHNQGFGLMSSLVAARHNNPHSCQDPQVIGNFVVTIFIYFNCNFSYTCNWLSICFTSFLCIINPFSFKWDFKSVSVRWGMLTLASFLWQSSSLPVEGSLVSEETNHTESSANTDTQEDTVVGKWTTPDETCFCIFPTKTGVDPAGTFSSVCSSKTLISWSSEVTF